MRDHPPGSAWTHRSRRVLVGCVIAITVILTGWMLRATAPVMIPLILSLFLALLVAPVDRWVGDRAPHRVSWLGRVAAMGVIVVAVAFFAGSMLIAAQQVIDRLPQDMSGWNALVPAADPASPEAPDSGEAGAGRAGGADADIADPPDGTELLPRVASFVASAGDSFLGRIAEWAVDYASAILGMTGTVLGGAVFVFFLTLMMLVEAQNWRDKLLRLAAPESEDDALSAVREIAERLRRYLLVRTVMGAVTALMYAGWLWLFGVELLFVWGLLAFLLNYIPTIGSLVAGVAPVIYALLTRDPGTALFVGGGLLLIEQVMGNYVDPRVQGSQVSISPLVVLVVLLFWGWTWGIAGAVLAVPITIAILIVSAHVTPMRPLAILLGDDPDEGSSESSAGGTKA
jgi:AI-2 transport protein TqsA